VLVTSSNSFVRAEQAAPYDDIIIRRGRFL